MGAGQSSTKIASTTPFPSKDIERVELFSVIFMRLLKKTDILDIRALTKGPGACGDYIILLSSELNKEFGKVKLEAARDSTASTIQEFLFAKSKTVTSESPADQAACNSLAIFYMRALQLISALTLSIYTPPDLVSRIRNRVFQSALKAQQKGVTLTLEQKEELRIKREDWFKKFLSSAGSSKNVYQFQGKPSLKYNKIAQQLIYTDEDENEYKAKVAIKEPDTYTINDELIKPGAYWIELADPKNDESIYRALVYSDKKAYLYENKKSVTNVKEEPILFVQNWTDDLASVFLQYITPVKPTPTPNSLSSRSRYGFGYGGTRKLHGGQYRGRNNNNNTRRRNNVPVTPIVKPNTSLDLSPTTALPRGFQDSYRSIVRWSTDFASWSEASPASYRAVLLYIQPTLPTGAPTSYMCVDNWSQKQLRYIPPFAALEALYFNRDDGTPSPENQQKLTDLVGAIRSLYLQYYPAKQKNTNAAKPATNFLDVSTPPMNEAIRNIICSKRTAQGDVLIDAKLAPILAKAQKEILDEYKVHFENAYNLLIKIFVTQKNASGETTVKFSDAIINSPKGARAELEDTIRVARGVIANHYMGVETIYYEAIKEVINQSK